jgi:hypothetical protein
MNPQLFVSALAATLLSSTTIAGELRASIGIPVVGAVFYSSGIVFRGSNALVHRHHHRRYYADNNDYPYDPYRGQSIYAAPVVIYQQPDPINELRILCAPTVARVCSGSVCVICN